MYRYDKMHCKVYFREFLHNDIAFYFAVSQCLYHCDQNKH